MDVQESTSSPVPKQQPGKKQSQDGSHRLLVSPVKKLSALRLVSPIDVDQEQNDLEVASVLAEGGSVSPTKPKRHETPVRPATVMTNIQRGNVQTITPVFQNITIHQMAAQGELNMLKHEAEGGTDLDQLDEYGFSPLLWAAANGQLITLQYLVDMKVDLDVVGNHGENALLFSSCYGYTDIVKLLLKLGMDVNYVDEMGNSALMYAAFSNQPGCVKILLEYGADMTMQNEDNHTAFDLAMGQGNKADGIRMAMPEHRSSSLRIKRELNKHTKATFLSVILIVTFVENVYVRKRSIKLITTKGLDCVCGKD